MGKNDFDIDFDFEKEYGFDPKSFLGSDAGDDNVDLNAFSDEELGLTPQRDGAASGSGDLFQDENMDDSFDLDENLDDFLNMGKEDEEGDYPQDDPEDFSDEEEFSDPDVYEQDSDLSGEDYSEEMEMDQQDYTQGAQGYIPEEYDAEAEQDAAQEDSSRRRERPRKPRQTKKVNLPKVAMPNVFGKFYDLYFAPVFHKELREPVPDPNNPRRRRRKTPMQIFKEAGVLLQKYEDLEKE